MHVANTNKLIAEKSGWVALNFTTRPLVYWVGGVGHLFTGGRYTYEFAASVAAAQAALALGLLYSASRRLMGNPVLRISALAFIAFLPVTIVTTVVYAADSFALLPFALAAWAMARAVKAAATRAALGYAGLTAFALIYGNLAKLPFAYLSGAVVGLLLGFCWCRQMTWRRGFLIGSVVVVPTTAAGGMIHAANQAYLKDAPPAVVHSFNWQGTGELTWRSLVGLKRTDARVLDAPSYWSTVQIDGAVVQPMVVNNGFSYPALLHLGVFTDLLDFTHRGGFDRTQPRPTRRQYFAVWAVRSAMVFSVTGVIALVAFGVVTSTALVQRKLTLPADLLVWGGLAFAWFLPLVLTLPYVGGAYTFGYWLPRLVLPALWGFSLILFWWLDQRLAARSRLFAVIVALAVLGQTGLHVAGTWY